MNKIYILWLFLLGTLNLNAQENPEGEYMNAYVVVSDTSQNYFELRQKMFDLHEKLKIKIDTMGRGFNKEKNRICLPEDDEDEIYAGQYFIRRYPSETLSLEYLSYYTEGPKAGENTMALVTAITDDKEEADQKLLEVKKHSDKAFIVNSRIYMGCMH
ncbi:hypothetical protein [Pseudozobellia thermophila]|uniref:Uncharacterized protein n=1 Tax=Pseudozobellia thermophila TaxID=192903 RepID=A0A1M6NRE1_9FLAO|nr:hypothetical protein [Pseudozobellia thermophila]SHJ98255.1 hypothetical protein SAMN04488513_11512 [Pseudozobellia thermophila]